MENTIQEFKARARDIVDDAINHLQTLRDGYDLEELSEEALTLELNEKTNKENASIDSIVVEVNEKSLLGSFFKTVLFSFSFVLMFVGSYYWAVIGIVGMLIHTWLDFFSENCVRVQELAWL